MDALSLFASLADGHVRIRAPCQVKSLCYYYRRRAICAVSMARRQVQAVWQRLWHITDLLRKRRVHLCVCVGGSARVGWDKSRNMKGVGSTDQGRRRRKKKKGKLSLRWHSEDASVFKIKTDGWLRGVKSGEETRRGEDQSFSLAPGENKRNRDTNKKRLQMVLMRQTLAHQRGRTPQRSTNISICWSPLSLWFGWALQSSIYVRQDEIKSNPSSSKKGTARI